MIMKLVFATNNQHKLFEISQLLGDSFSLVNLKDINFTDDIPEDYPTLEENSLFKARYISSLTGLDVFADDTGLEVYALGGKPGVHSARFAGPGRDFDANIDLLLELLGNNPDRRARFRTVIALILGGKEYLFEGKVEGKIISERRGTNGFGYDPVFIPDGKELTFAQMPISEKNLISHRAEAFKGLKKFLNELSSGGNNNLK
jgi:XTP/dITP diphosphohydrolase